MTSVARTFLAVAAVAVSPMATAQITPSMTGPAKPAAIIDEGEYSGAKARLVMEGFARCVVARHRTAVMRAIAFPPMSLDENKALGKLVDDKCLLNGTMNFSPVHFRGGLYTALYRERFGAGMGTLKADAVDFAFGVTLSPGSAMASGVALRKFLDCAVRRQPAAAHQVVTGKAGSAMENAGFSALMAGLSACVDKNARLRFTRTELEGLIAEVLYLDTIAPELPGIEK
ncbi:MAG: hypothetical protein J0J06_06645 [Sphingomonas sp.]|nr:hypothetical protein [Sphingomonas sp.]